MTEHDPEHRKVLFEEQCEECVSEREISDEGDGEGRGGDELNKEA